MGIQSFLLGWKLGWKAQYIGGFTICIKDTRQKHQKGQTCKRSFREPSNARDSAAEFEENTLGVPFRISSIVDELTEVGRCET